MQLNRATADKHSALAAALTDLRCQVVLSFGLVNSNYHNMKAARLAGWAWTPVHLV